MQLVEVTIDSLAEVGYVGTTLAEIARRADVSPGLVAHYFGDKDGLLEAAFRTLARTLAVRVRARLALARTPRGRVQAVIDINLAPEEFNKRTGTAWLAFWGQVLHVEGLKRVQTAYQRRMLSNLRSDLRRMIPGEDARSLAAMIAAMIDGVWLRAALSEWQEADSESACALLTAFVEGRLKDLAADVRGHRHRCCRAGRRAAGRRRHLPGAQPRHRCRARRAHRGRPGADRGGGGARARGTASLGGPRRRGTRPRAAACGATAARAQRRTGAARDLEYRQAHPGNAGGRRDLRRGVPRVLRRSRRRHCRGAPGLRSRGFRLHAPRAPRGGRGHRRLELPAADRVLEIRSRARLRQCHDLQARRAHTAHGVEARGDLSRGRAARGCVPGGAGYGGDRTAAHAPSAHPQDLAHRGGDHGQGGDGRCGRIAQAGDARARRQIAAHRLR